MFSFSISGPKVPKFYVLDPGFEGQGLGFS